VFSTSFFSGSLLLLIGVDHRVHEPLSRLFVNKLHCPSFFVSLNLADSRQNVLVLNDTDELLEDVVSVVICNQLVLRDFLLDRDRSKVDASLSFFSA
jgi:hypothetical protein